MRSTFIHRAFRLRGLWMLLCLWSILPAVAQEGFNPDNPPEPATLYKVTVNCTPEGAAYLSGNGKYTKGSKVWIYSSAQSYSYKFRHWLKNGVQFEQTSTNFYHTVGEEAVTYTAVYEYAPELPGEPSMVLQHRLWLESSPEGACSFNRTSGEKALDEEFVYVNAYPNQGYDFKGWYQNGVLVSESSAFNYMMPAQTTTLTAKFAFNPANPGEPSGGEQDNVDTGMAGDMNDDKVIDVSDAVAILALYLNQGADANASRADVNGDGIVDVSDAVEIINQYLGNK